MTEDAAGNGLAKEGAGALSLTGANNYSGATSVNAGSLFANNSSGSATGTGNVTVNNSGTTLGGTGVITGTVNVGAGANLVVGSTAAAGTTETLHIGSLTLASTSNFTVDLMGTAVGSSYDQLLVMGAVNLGGANLIVNAGAGLNLLDKFFIVSNDGVDAINGIFSQNATVSSGNYLFAINYLDNFGGVGPGNDISLTVTAVPEPGTWIGGSLAFLAIGYTQRRRFLKRRAS